ncbi:MAG TPA: hypothetical protein VEL68_00265 [Thermodesulfobacteriota bacterium]|nr:hypothetical protein [Thermodesulfobacteriota bacterium]
MGIGGDINSIQPSFSVQGRHRAMEKILVGTGLREGPRIEKEGLIQLARRILKSDADLNFLLRLETEELETLVACIRVRLELENK